MNINFYLWAGVIILAIIIEIITETTLVSIWFAFGAFISMILNYFKIDFTIQLIIFALCSILLLVLLRPATRKLIRKDIIPSNLDRYIGMETVLLSDFDINNLGTVKINDVVWNVKSVDNSIIKKGSLVKIILIEGSKLIVEKI